jgi:inorganic triphosphatase YgiF
MREVELKLEIRPEDVRRLIQSPALRERAAGQAVTRSLRTVYFDTPDLGLARRGMALRVRRDGRRLVQTLKARGPQRGPHFDRIEYEAALATEEPDPGLVPDRELRAQIEAATAGSALAPVIETRIRRTRRILREGDASLELDLDVGELRAGGESRPVCEVELELRSGDASALYDAALAILDAVPVRLSTVSKADLGYAMLSGAPPAPRKAEPLALAPDATLDDVIAATLENCFEQVLGNHAPAHLGRDPEGVHQMRVGVRRLRSALRLFGPVLPAEPTRRLEAELRWLGLELGAVRDLDVFAAELLEPVLEARRGEKGFERLREIAAAQRSERHEVLRRALDAPRATRLALELGRWLARRGWREQPEGELSARLLAPARPLAAELLAARDRKARQLGERIQELAPPELHRLRIRLKRLRYAGELLGGLYPGRRRERYLERLPELQDLLGRLADVATAQRLLAGLLERVDPDSRPACARAAGFVGGWAAAGAARATRRLVRLWGRFAAARPFWTGARGAGRRPPDAPVGR